VLGHVRNAPQTLQLDSGRRSRRSKGEKQQGEYRGEEIGIVGNEEMEGRREKRSRKEEQSERKEGKGRGWSRKEKKKKGSVSHAPYFYKLGLSTETELCGQVFV